ncbi:PREDICTED: LOW QUALITY PROTEIN: allene oxide synthase, chloroplastic-like [Branchiostoma belcheri]|uniref:sterol 22-desaturase n=1 Tax=Branchiostoma belcheri TaxID=7741 RepID=A0A6P4ZZ89_BRABE|nr:PREDICTED: LOW QUALITY PROTEIN: allene oxide synthase, chloroplastic-like [Branchiostoma belcheri]
MGAGASNTKGLIQQVKKGPHRLKHHLENPAVVRTNVGVPVVALLNQETIQYIFNTDLVDKERYYLGYVGVREELTHGYCPSMFVNGEEHRRKKAFLIDALQRSRETLPSVLNAHILSHFEEWSRARVVTDFEDRVFFLVSDVMTESVFGSKVDGRLALNWLQGLMKIRTRIPIPSIARAKQHTLASAALPVLLKTIQESPKYQELIGLCHAHGIEEEEDGIVSVIFAVIFNAVAASSSVIVTFIARLYKECHGSRENNLLRATLEVLKKHGGITEESLDDMKLLESFLLEVLRLHPPVFDFFGVAKQDFVISTRKEKVEVRKGEQLLGSCFWAQRDVSVFLRPGLFRCNRFLDEEGGGDKRKHLVFPHGSLTEPPDLDSHQCPGQGIAFFLMKATLAVLLSYCSWELKSIPVWSDKTARLGKPDDLVSLTRFEFNSNKARRVMGP